MSGPVICSPWFCCHGLWVLESSAPQHSTGCCRSAVKPCMKHGIVGWLFSMRAPCNAKPALVFTRWHPPWRIDLPALKILSGSLRFSWSCRLTTRVTAAVHSPMTTPSRAWRRVWSSSLMPSHTGERIVNCCWPVLILTDLGSVIGSSKSWPRSLGICPARCSWMDELWWLGRAPPTRPFRPFWISPWSCRPQRRGPILCACLRPIFIRSRNGNDS